MYFLLLLLGITIRKYSSHILGLHLLLRKMSLYIHQSNSGLDFIVTTEDEPESDSDPQGEYQHETVETKDSIESLVSLEENIFDVPTFNEEPEPSTKEVEINFFSNDSNEETPPRTGNTLGFNKQPSNPKKEAMIKKKKEEPQAKSVQFVQKLSPL